MHEKGNVDMSREVSGKAPGGGVLTPRGTQVVEAVAPTGVQNRNVAAVVASIARLAEGNSENMVDLVSGVVSTRTVQLGIKVTVGWRSASERIPGRANLSNSVAFSNRGDAEAFLGQACRSECLDPKTSERLAADIHREPLAAFTAWPENWNLRSLPHRAHSVEPCTECRGEGKTTCRSGCYNGLAACNACETTGRLRCQSCGGQRGAWVDGYFRNCRTCGGTGRDRSCMLCNGTGKARCHFCNGSGKVHCEYCHGLAAHTHAYSTALVGELSRSIEFGSGLPNGFRKACEAIPRDDLVSREGRLTHVQVASGPALAAATLDLELNHVRAEMICGDVPISVDAIGTSLRIPEMPHFLDDLAGETARAMSSLSRQRPVACLLEAKKTRLSHEMLSATGQGTNFDAAKLSRHWQGAASPGFLSGLNTSLRTAYSRAASSTVRETWLWATPAIIAATVLANVYHLPGALGLTARPLHPAPLAGLASISAALACEFVVVMPLLFGSWLLAGLRGRKVLRAALGSLARRRPRQGFWPPAVAIVAVLSGFAFARTNLDAATFGLPHPSWTDTRGRNLAQVSAEFIPALASPSNSPRSPLVKTPQISSAPQSGTRANLGQR